MLENLRHYADEFRKGNNFFSVKLIYKCTIIALGILHLINGVFFLFASTLSLTIVNVAIAALLFTTIHTMVDHHDLISLYMLLLLEIIVMIFAITMILGWNSGFSSYYYAAVASTFYFSYVNQNKDGSRHMLPLMLSLLIILFFFANYYLMLYIPPLLPVASSFWAQVINIFNTLASYAIMITFFYLYIWDIQSKNNILAEQNRKLDELAYKDPLTKLLNRRSMNEILNNRMDLLKRTGKRFTIILGDIDDFKHVNDTYGHDAGDMVLVAVAKTIQSMCGPNDAVCRWGGEEILILIQEPLEMGVVKAEKIRSSIEQIVVDFQGQRIIITMTFGVTESMPGFRIENLIQQADDKLYYGKKHGKNQVVAYLKQL